MTVSCSTNTSRMYTHFGVIGGDITLLHLSYLIKTSFTKCGEEAFRSRTVDVQFYQNIICTLLSKY